LTYAQELPEYSGLINGVITGIFDLSSWIYYGMNLLYFQYNFNISYMLLIWTSTGLLWILFSFFMDVPKYLKKEMVNEFEKNEKMIEEIEIKIENNLKEGEEINIETNLIKIKEMQSETKFIELSNEPNIEQSVIEKGLVIDNDIFLESNKDMKLIENEINQIKGEDIYNKPIPNTPEDIYIEMKEIKGEDFEMKEIKGEDIEIYNETIPTTPEDDEYIFEQKNLNVEYKINESLLPSENLKAEKKYKKMIKFLIRLIPKEIFTKEIISAQILFFVQMLASGLFMSTILERAIWVTDSYDEALKMNNIFSILFSIVGVLSSFIFGYLCDKIGVIKSYIILSIFSLIWVIASVIKIYWVSYISYVAFLSWRLLMFQLMSTWIFQTYPKEKASTLYGYLLTCGVFIIFFLYFINYSIVYFLNNNYLWPGLIIVILFFLF
jgi:hypothetical protein